MQSAEGTPTTGTTPTTEATPAAGGVRAVPRGLAGVVVTDTGLGDVRGREGFYHYRQYSAVELAESRTFEDVWHLMFHGRLPDAAEGAAFLALLTALHRLSRGLEPVEPRTDLPYAANYLYMLSGTEPEPARARAVERYLVSTVDHGFNASTFTGRVIASTGADVVAGLTGAIGALSGPLHGGAPSRALDTLDAIGTPDRIRPWITERVLAGSRIMGFGHPVYRTEDPRSRMLRSVAEGFGGPLVEFAVQVEKEVVAILAELKPGRELHTNVEFYAGVVMELCGLPREMFTPTFCAARVVGWSANILEQAADSKIIRPAARYVGPPPPQPVPAV